MDVMEKYDNSITAEEKMRMLLDQWSTYVEMAERNTEKRITTNNLYVTMNLALFAIVTLNANYENILLAILGIVISVMWFKSIKSYKKLSSIKYGIVQEIEEQLLLAPFTIEWERINKEKHSNLTGIEIVLPGIFIGLYSLLCMIFITVKIANELCLCIGG